LSPSVVKRRSADAPSTIGDRFGAVDDLVADRLVQEPVERLALLVVAAAERAIDTLWSAEAMAA
jgi:hypothetical protein